MVEQKRPVSTPLFENILAQPDALRVVGKRQASEGRADLEKAAAVLRDSEKIVLTGMGASLFACRPAGYSLSRAGAAVSVVEAAELLYFLDGSLDGDTAVLLVSRSGESVEVVKLLDVLAERGCKTVGVANVEGSTLLERTNVGVLLGSPADQLVAIQTYIATAATLILLGCAYRGQLEDGLSELGSAVALLGEFLPICVKASEGWQDFDGASPLYILGRGASLASVNEGVLLMHETAKFPAIGMSVAQFRHGPVEAADKQMRAIVLGTQKATEAHDRQLAEDLIAMGAKVRWLGRLAAGSQVAQLVGWPKGIPTLFQCIFEIVPLQLLAYRTAEARGVTPGDFRWAPAVTSSESGFPVLSGNR